MPTQKELRAEAHERKIARTRARWLYEWNAREELARRRYQALKRWRARHPDAAREQSRKDAHKKRNSGRDLAEHLPDEYRRLAMYVCGHKCLACGSDDATIDHVIPLSRGGKNDLDNLQVLCFSCNSRKHAKSTDFRSHEMIFGLSIVRFLEAYSP